MEDLITFSITVFTGFFAIMNPIANVPIFTSLVQGADTEKQKEIASKSTLIAFIIVVSFVILGQFIFELFGITIPAFKITGGILIFYVGFEMLQSKKSSVKHLKSPNIDEDIAISPLAIPILAGPGTIVTATNYVTDADFVQTFIVVGVFGLMCVITYFVFILSEKLVKLVGNNFISVVGKIMGLIIAIIGTNMIIEGIKITFNIS
ncbi:MarC family protein [Portibacter lacus]|uniref:UPF0056 membrane protein n=1 Tax=Portibacter lacus TaxID=1099794 RepID=A0AA37SP16_9BACT|nr:MarC family protein [Portibacter lacus]GLR16524.1 UPF0056 inner membrane protein [Portibacter lacus]